MSRNGSGTMTVPNTMVSGTTITASDHNENYSDIAAELTNSVAVDGQSTMTGPLKAASGTVAAPGVAFGADPDSGMYRIGANNIGVAVAGAKVLDVSATGLDVTGAYTVGGAALFPAGIVLPYAGSSAPTGFLLCYGQSLLRADYAALFTAIGTTYGAADGTHFTLPDLRGRVAAGKDDMGGSAAGRLTNTTMSADGITLGATGGTETRAILQANLPNVNFTSTASNIVTSNVGAGFASVGNGGAIVGLGLAAIGTGMGAISVASGGSGTALNVTQPTLILNYIIKT